MKTAQQLQAAVDRMFAPDSQWHYPELTNSGYVIVPAHYLASLQEDRALWDAVEASCMDVCQTIHGEWLAEVPDKGIRQYSDTPREAVAKARDAIEEGE